MTDQPDLKARVEELERENAALTKALTGLTRGGSEYFIRKGDRFVADIPFCVAEIRERFQRDGQRAINALHDKKAAESSLVLAEKVVEALTETLAMAEMYIPVPLQAPGFKRARAALTAYEENTSDTSARNVPAREGRKQEPSSSCANSGGTASPKSDSAEGH